MCVVDDEFVKRFYPPGTDPIGHRIWFGSSTPTDSTKYITIVGVVGHTKHEGLDADARVQVYFPFSSYLRGGGGSFLSFAVRTTGDPLAAAGAVRAAVQSIDRDQPLSQIAALDDMVDRSM